MILLIHRFQVLLMSLTDRAKADLMGQVKFLKDTYVSRGELHPDAAVFLDAALR